MITYQVIYKYKQCALVYQVSNFPSIHDVVVFIKKLYSPTFEKKGIIPEKVRVIRSTGKEVDIYRLGLVVKCK